MAKTVIIYESKYGSTAEAVKDISRILGCPSFRATEFPQARKDEFDLYIIGGPVYMGYMDSRVTEFVKANQSWLKNKKTAVFCACLAPPQAVGKYLEPFKQLLGEGVVYAGSIVGRLNVAKLDDADRVNMTGYCKGLGVPLADVNFSSEADRVRVCRELSGACGLA